MADLYIATNGSSGDAIFRKDADSPTGRRCLVNRTNLDAELWAICERSVNAPTTDLYLQSDGRDMTVWHDDKPLLTEHQAGPVLWAHLVATLPTRDEPQPEPLGLGAVVEDADGRQWVRTDQQEWTSAGDYTDDFRSIDVRRVLSEGYVSEVITPAPEPTPDERPFKVGDLVKVADDATWDPMQIGKGKRSAVAGQTRAIKRVDDGLGETTVEPGIRVHTRYLTHADADAPC